MMAARLAVGFAAIGVAVTLSLADAPTQSVASKPPPTAVTAPVAKLEILPAPAALTQPIMAEQSAQPSTARSKVSADHPEQLAARIDSSVVTARPEGKIDPAPPTAPERTSYMSLFLEGSAAVFGVLSVAAAVIAFALAFIGVTNYAKFKDRALKEVTEHMKKEVDNRITSAAQNEITNVIKSALDPKIAEAIDEARKKLAEEVRRMVVEEEWRGALIDEVQARVTERLQPKAQSTAPDEFEQPPST